SYRSGEADQGVVQTWLAAGRIELLGHDAVEVDHILGRQRELPRFGVVVTEDSDQILQRERVGTVARGNDQVPIDQHCGTKSRCRLRCEGLACAEMIAVAVRRRID